MLVKMLVKALPPGCRVSNIKRKKPKIQKSKEKEIKNSKIERERSQKFKN